MTLESQGGGAANPGASDPAGAGAQSSPQGAVASTTDWIAALGPELKGVVETKGYKTPADVVQAYVHAQKAIGADKIVVPKDGVWDDEARTRLGIPKDATGYTVKRPENLPRGLDYDEKFEGAAKAVAHKLGLLPSQVQGLVEFYTGYQSEGFTAVQSANHKATEDAASALKTEYGAAYDAKLAQAQRAARYFGGDALVQVLNSTGVGNNPDVIRAFAKIGTLMGEDPLKTGQAAGFNLTPAEARAEANKLMSHEAYMKGDHPEHAEIVQKVAALFEQAYTQ